ncbi:MAG: hypothetical protein ABH888_03620 [Patescibacteria group bacterium]
MPKQLEDIFVNSNPENPKEAKAEGKDIKQEKVLQTESPFINLEKSKIKEQETKKENWIKRAGDGLLKNKVAIGKMLSGVAGSYFGVKIIYDLPAWIKQKKEVKEEQEVLNETLKIINNAITDRKKEKKEEKEELKTEEEIKDENRKKEILNKLKGIKEGERNGGQEKKEGEKEEKEGEKGGGQKSKEEEKDELRQELSLIRMKDKGYKNLVDAAKLFKKNIDQAEYVDEKDRKMLKQELGLIMKGCVKKEENIINEQNQEVTEVISDYVETKIKKMQIVKEGLNSFCTFTGNYALKGLTYGACALVERGQKIAQQDSRKTRLEEKRTKLKKSLNEELPKQEVEQKEKDNFVKKLIINGIKETLHDAFKKDVEFKDRLKAYGVLARFVSIGLLGGQEVFSEGGGALSKIFDIDRYSDRLDEIKKAKGIFGTIRSITNIDETIERTTQIGEGAARFGKKAMQSSGLIAEEAFGSTEIQEAVNSGGIKLRTPEVSEAPKAEQLDFSDATIRKGEGIEHVLIRQLKTNPENFGFKGNLNNADAVKEWAGGEAHRMAIKAGYVDLKTGQEIRIGTKGIDSVAYVIEKNQEGELSIHEHFKNDEKVFKSVEIHKLAEDFKSAKFEGKELESYEYKHGHKIVEHPQSDAHHTTPKGKPSETYKIVEDKEALSPKEQSETYKIVTNKENYQILRAIDKNLTDTEFVAMAKSGEAKTILDFVKAHEKGNVSYGFIQYMEAIDAVRLVQETKANISYEEAFKHFDFLKGLKGNPNAMEAAVEVFNGKIDKDIFGKLFSEGVDEKNFYFKNGVCKLKEVIEGFDYVVQEKNGVIKFWIDGPSLQNFGKPGMVLNNENLAEAKNFLEDNKDYVKKFREAQS